MSKVSARPQTGNNIERPMTTKAAGYSKARRDPHRGAAGFPAVWISGHRSAAAGL